MGSTTVDAWAPPPDQYNTSVVHSDIIPAPVNTATTAAAPIATSFNTGSTGSLIGWPLMRMGMPVNSPSFAGLKSTNAPYSRRNVTTANPVNTVAWMFRDFQNTSA